eukprot:sb/3466983/
MLSLSSIPMNCIDGNLNRRTSKTNTAQWGNNNNFLSVFNSDQEVRLWKSLGNLAGEHQQVDSIIRKPKSDPWACQRDGLKARSLTLTSQNGAERFCFHRNSDPQPWVGSKRSDHPAAERKREDAVTCGYMALPMQEEPQLGPHKVILVGDSGVGKSSFMLRLCDDAFNEKMNPSFGLDFKTKTISLNGTEENLQIWDTAGQERFRSITQSYFRKVDGIILVYDITHEESFLNLQNWVTCIQESGQLSAPMTIVGNKLDLEHVRCVSREMAAELADVSFFFFILYSQIPFFSHQIPRVLNRQNNCMIFFESIVIL